MDNNYNLTLKNITKEFPGVKALDDVTINIERGTIHGLVGENGAGKSTLIKVLAGIYQPNKGEIILDGKPCRFNSPIEARRAGISVVHQEIKLAEPLSVAENMFLGNERGSKFKVDWAETFDKADSLLAEVGLKESSHTLIKDIGVGKQQLVEIAKALGKKVRLLILDEPTASLNENESKHLLDLLLEFKKQGMTSIIISHKLNEISYVADKITVIRDGAVIKTLDKSKDDFSENTIIAAMVGRDITDRFPKRASKVGDVCFEVKN